MENIKILQIVGFKNSGKTTLMNRFIELARIADKKVAAIKHHGHGGKPDQPSGSTDSMQFLESGAASSLVYGDGMVQMHLQELDENLSAFIKFSRAADPDLILIEGFKRAPYPKVAMVRSAEDWQLLKDLEKIRLVIVRPGVQLEGADWVASDDQAAIDRFFGEWMEGDTDEGI